MARRRARWLAAGVLPALILVMSQAGSPPAGAAHTGGLKINTGPSLETTHGTATTAALPGDSGDYAHLSPEGEIGVSAPDGRTLWQLQTRSLFAAWHLHLSTTSLPSTSALQVPLVRDPANPFLLDFAQQDAVADVHPVAAGYLAGSRVPDVAVAQLAGSLLDSPHFQWPFNVPGSPLHEGTFVTVINGLTGQILYSHLDPGYVTQLAITGGLLIVGNETGDPGSLSQLGAWRSVTNVRALSFSQSGGGLAARTAWTYSTGAPWASVLDMQQAGNDIALDWTDTPIGLGVPGPPDGHVVLIGPDGSVRWTVATPGYPILSSYDATRRLLVIADQTDPTVAIGYTLAGLRLSNGSTAVAVRMPGVLPTALSIGGNTWFTGAVVTTKHLANGFTFGFTAGRVSAVDPGSGRVLWSTTLHGPFSHAAYPATVLWSGTPEAGGTVLVGADRGQANGPTPQRPFSARYDLSGLSARDGHLLWDRFGDVADPLSTRLAGPPSRPVAVGVTDDNDAVSYDPATGAVLGVAPLLGDMDAAIRQDVNGQPALIVGSQSGGVFALDASDPARVLWQVYAGGAVHQIALAWPNPGAPPVLVVAATTQVDVLNLNTGRIQVARDYPHQYAWNVTVGRIGSHRAAVVVATNHLSAFDAGTGRTLWTYRPPVAAYFSNAAIVDGVTVADYQNQAALNVQPTTMAAVGIGATGKPAWTASASTATISHPVLWHGVFASPDISGAGSTGVALAWQTTSGTGEVDVRDAVTGALLYSDSIAGQLVFTLTGWTIDPPLGLIAVGLNSNSEVIQPGGAVVINNLIGSSSAVVDSAGAPVFLDASIGVSAYPGATLQDLEGTAAATNSDFNQGTLIPAGPPASGEVIALPLDMTAWEVVDGAEEGLLVQEIFADYHPFIYGVDLLKVTGTPTATAAPLRPVRRHRPVRPSSVTVGNAPALGVGTAMPQLELKVHGYTRAGKPVFAQTAPAGYDPATIGAYLGLHGDGAGQTVAVVDAYRDPKIVGDVNEFSAQFGLPQVCGTSGAGSQCFNFKTIAPDGTAGENSDWALETSLDVEWIHAIAPKAAVRLVDARQATFAALFRAATDAAALRPDAISMSWDFTGGEFSGETYYDRHCELAHSVCVVSTGDFGHPGGYPAYNPWVLAVGGTTLELTPAGAVSSEVSWSLSGGGQSYFEPKSAAQQGVSPGRFRGIPDVSFDADPNTGVAVYDSVPYLGQAGWFEVGGTSLGAPSWSAILASADQLRAAAGKSRLTSAGDQAARAVYAATSALADITTGPANGLCPKECVPGPGYDFVTGLGSPRAGIDGAIAAAP